MQQQTTNKQEQMDNQDEEEICPITSLNLQEWQQSLSDFYTEIPLATENCGELLRQWQEVEIEIVVGTIEQHNIQILEMEALTN
uniref:Uncharacterized protein n=1 Tax=Romanomermis culicivorax TaxID=13658 RepID=A0A915IGU4_ROMCU